MTIANNIIALALKNSGINGIGQTSSAEDTNDAFTLLNDMIGQWSIQRTIMVIPGTLITFPDLTTDVAFWTGNENVLLTTLAVRLRSAYNLPADDLMNQIAESTLQQLQANNKQFQPALHGGITTTPVQIIFLALRMAGRINDKQSVADGSADVDSAFALLVNMLAQWQRKRWLVPDLTETVLVATGAASYSIGPASSFALARPDRIESAFARLLPAVAPVSLPGQFINNGGLIQILPGNSLPTSPVGLLPGAYWNDGGLLAIVTGTGPQAGQSFVDYPLGIIESREDYNRIGLKALGAPPAAVFYDSAWPVGTLYFWPIPQAASYELHIFTKATLPVYATVNDPLGLPFEYNDALVSNLACRIKALNGEEPSQYLAGQARASLNTIRLANTQIASLQMPAGLPGRGARGGRAAMSDPAFQTGWWG